MQTQAEEGIDVQKDAAPEQEAPKPKVLRTYGQKQAKPDAVTDADAPTLPQDLLALLGGKR